MAVVLLCLAFIEKTLAADLYTAGWKAAAKASLGKVLEKAHEDGVLSESDWRTFRRLADLRNSRAHFQGYGNPKEKQPSLMDRTIRENARAKEGKEEADRARQKAAAELHLPCNDQGHVQIPDAQIQYVDESGNIGRVNVEVTSDQYTQASIAAKSAAGFSMHGGKGGQASNTRSGLSSLGGGGGRRGGGRGGRDPASVEL